MHKIPYDFEIQKTKTSVDKPEKRTCHVMDFAVLKSENKRNQKYGQITGSCHRTEKLLNMKGAVIHFVDGILGMISKGLEKRLD